MASMLNTDLLKLYPQWGERIAFNEGYQAQKLSIARSAGSDAFKLGLDRNYARSAFFESREFIQNENVQIESVEVDSVGDVTDGEETLGMESCVSGESIDSDNEFAYMQPIWEAQDSHYEESFDSNVYADA